MLYHQPTTGQPGSPDREAVLLERSLTFSCFFRCDRPNRSSVSGLPPSTFGLPWVVRVPARLSFRGFRVNNLRKRWLLRVGRWLGASPRGQASPWEQRPRPSRQLGAAERLYRWSKALGFRPRAVRASICESRAKQDSRWTKNERARLAVNAASRKGKNAAVTPAGCCGAIRTSLLPVESKASEGRTAPRGMRFRNRKKRGEPHGRQLGATNQHGRGGVSRQGGAKPRRRNAGASWLDEPRRLRKRNREWTPRTQHDGGAIFGQPQERQSGVERRMLATTGERFTN